MSNIKFVMLDFDGTVANTLQSILYCADKVGQAEGYSIDLELLTRNLGYTTYGAFALLTNSDDPVLINRLCDEYHRIYNSEGVEMITLFDGVLDTVQRLHAKGVKFAIASNNMSYVIEGICRRLGLMPYIDNIVGLDCVSNGKPEPDIAIESMHRAGFSAQESIVVGDSTFDMGMGCNAGCRCCAVTYGSNDRQTLEQSGAEWIIDNFSELEKIVLG